MTGLLGLALVPSLVIVAEGTPDVFKHIEGQPPRSGGLDLLLHLGNLRLRLASQAGIARPKLAAEVEAEKGML